MLAWLLALLSIASLAQAAPAPAPDRFVVRAWGTRDGLPQNTVTAMFQTRDGYLWLGTFGGLVRFDGNSFTVFDPGNTPGLSSARISALHEGPTGILWIGTDSGLSWLEHGRFTSYPVTDGVMAVHEDRRGRVWVAVAAGAGVSRFEEARWSPWTRSGRAPSRLSKRLTGISGWTRRKVSCVSKRVAGRPC